MAKNKQQDKPAVSFDEIIKADRSKRKAEALAQEIFGKNRRQSAPSAGNNNNNRKPQTPLGGSLASRVGVNKRSSSTASLPTLNKQQNRNAQKNNRNARQSQAGAAAVHAAVQQNPQSFTLKERAHVAKTDENETEISIRGAAGPYCIVASNFAPGTTAADIESVMAPVGGEMAGCKLIASQPTVIAEMIFLERTGADNVINMFNGKKADGRILYVYLKEGGPTQPLNAPPPRIASPVVVVEPVQQQGAEDTMDVEQPFQIDTQPSPLPPQDPSPRPSYSRPPRDGRPSYREDYDRAPRHADPEYQDGRYGFGDQRYDYDRRPRYRDEGRMYSDDMMRGAGRRGGGGRGQRYR